MPGDAPTERSGLAVAAVLGLALPAAALALRLGAAHGTRALSGAMPRAQMTAGVPQVGVLFATASSTHHGCTATVVASPRGDLLLTAAHCVSGRGAGMVFVPGFRNGSSPYGRWVVTAAYVAGGWLAGQDPRADYAFLTVAPQAVAGTTTEIEQVTGAYRLGTTATSGERITVPGYPGGAGNNPISCRTTVFMTSGFPSFGCRGYVGGTSGSPWLINNSHGPRIVGVIGGLNQGGCVDYISYSSPLAAARTAYVRALTHEVADVAPAAGSDGCS